MNKKELEEITKKIIESANSAGSETELQVDVTHILKVFFDKYGIEYKPHQNRTVIKGRPDSLYGRAVIEYKVPKTLKSKAKSKDAVIETQKNIVELSNKYPTEDKSKYFGIILDGFNIIFTKFRNDRWITEPTLEVNVETIRKMIEYLRALARKPLHPDFMLSDFGPGSDLAKKICSIIL